MGRGRSEGGLRIADFELRNGKAKSKAVSAKGEVARLLRGEVRRGELRKMGAEDGKGKVESRKTGSGNFEFRNVRLRRGEIFWWPWRAQPGIREAGTPSAADRNRAAYRACHCRQHWIAPTARIYRDWQYGERRFADRESHQEITSTNADHRGGAGPAPAKFSAGRIASTRNPRCSRAGGGFCLASGGRANCSVVGNKGDAAGLSSGFFGHGLPPACLQLKSLYSAPDATALDSAAIGAGLPDFHRRRVSGLPGCGEPRCGVLECDCQKRLCRSSGDIGRPACA